MFVGFCSVFNKQLLPNQIMDPGRANVSCTDRDLNSLLNRFQYSRKMSREESLNILFLEHVIFNLVDIQQRLRT